MYRDCLALEDEEGKLEKKVKEKCAYYRKRGRAPVDKFGLGPHFRRSGS